MGPSLLSAGDLAAFLRAHGGRAEDLGVDRRPRPDLHRRGTKGRRAGRRRLRAVDPRDRLVRVRQEHGRSGRQQLRRRRRVRHVQGRLPVPGCPDGRAGAGAAPAHLRRPRASARSRLRIRCSSPVRCASASGGECRPGGTSPGRGRLRPTTGTRSTGSTTAWLQRAAAAEFPWLRHEPGAEVSLQKCRGSSRCPESEAVAARSSLLVGRARRRARRLRTRRRCRPRRPRRRPPRHRPRPSRRSAPRPSTCRWTAGPKMMAQAAQAKLDLATIQPQLATRDRRARRGADALGPAHRAPRVPRRAPQPGRSSSSTRPRRGSVRARRARTRSRVAAGSTPRSKRCERRTTSST